MTRLEGFFYGPVSAARPYALSRILPLLLALDIWVLMIGHAGRYGVGGFNVAHFALLDALLPVPTSASYIGLLVLTGLLSLLYAFGQRARVLSVALCGLYTVSWASSMLDSYQHHYFISLVLVCLVLFPREQAPTRQPAEPKAGQDPGGGYALLTSTVAILYAYAALAKCDSAWLEGHTLRRISQAEVLLQPLVEQAARLNIGQDAFFALIATAVIPLELLVALAYALAPLRDRSSSRALGWFSHVGLLLALMLHLGAEELDLKIGWFSYYMLVLAVVCLGPATLVSKLMAPFAWLQARLIAQLREVKAEARAAQTPWVPLLVSLAMSALLVYVGNALDLPGAQTATTIAALALVGYTLFVWARKRAEVALGMALSAGASALVLWLVVSVSEARFDYYRFLGGDLARRGEVAEAIEIYVHGERYAPAGKSRRDKIAKLRAQLGARLRAQ